MTYKVPYITVKIYPVKFIAASHILKKRFHSQYSENASFILRFYGQTRKDEKFFSKYSSCRIRKNE